MALMHVKFETDEDDSRRYKMLEHEGPSRMIIQK